MPTNPEDTVPDLLLRNIPRDLVMAIEDALVVGAERAFASVDGADDGHLAHALGQQRHFKMTETFHRALLAGDAGPTSINGNNVVTGRSGLFTLARFNIQQGFWINGRRSETRRQMALANEAIEPLVQPGLFGTYAPPTDAVAFFVACFSGSRHVQPESPVSVQIAVPDREMRGWLFKEPVGEFLERYEAKPAAQVDRAVPTLKQGVGKRHQGGSAA